MTSHVSSVTLARRLKLFMIYDLGDVLVIHVANDFDKLFKVEVEK